MFNKFLNLFSPIITVIILFLIVPSPVSAILGTGVFDPFKKTILSVKAWVGPIAETFIYILFFYIAIVAILWVLTFILDWIISQNFVLITVDAPMVETGHAFILGLVNMTLILIFIFLAFALILNIQSLDVKKALPKLIIVALLLNFSLVFIGMAIDIANIFYQTFLKENLIYNMTSFLLRDAATHMGVLFTFIIVAVAGFAIPFFGVFAQVAFPTLVLTIFLPTILEIIFIMTISIFLILTFFIYIIVFAVRIFAIQILIILSPLAFVCLILPQTKKYWDMWLKEFLEWLFVGIFLLFFLKLGSLIFYTLIPETPIGIIPWIFPGTFPGYFPGEFFMFYLFLIIYFGLLLVLAKKFVPASAQGVISVTESFANKQVKKEWIATRKRLSKSFSSGLLNEETTKRMKKKGQKMLEEGEAGTGVKGLFRRLRGRRMVRVGTAGEIKREYAKKKEQAEHEKELKELEGLEGLTNEQIRTISATERSFGRKTALGEAAEKVLLKRRPDLAYAVKEGLTDAGLESRIRTTAITPEKIQAETKKVMDKMSIKELNNIKPKSWSNVNTLFALDESQIKELERKGSAATRNAIAKSANDNSLEINRKMSDLLRSTRPEDRAERERIRKMHHEILNNPKFSI